MTRSTDNITILVGKFNEATVFFSKNSLIGLSVNPLDFEVDLDKLSNIRLEAKDRDKSQIDQDIRRLKDIKALKDIKNFSDLEEKLKELGIDATHLKKPYHEIEYKGHKYRFVNPDCLSERSINALKREPNAVIFDGDLKNLLINVSEGKISSQYIPEFNEYFEI